MSKQESLSTQIENVDLKSPVDLIKNILGYGQREITEETTLLEIERQLQENGIISGELKHFNETSKLPKPKNGNKEMVIYIKSLKSKDTVDFQKGKEIYIENSEEYKKFQKDCSIYINDSNAKVLSVVCLTRPQDHISIVLIEKEYYLF